MGNRTPGNDKAIEVVVVEKPEDVERDEVAETGEPNDIDIILSSEREQVGDEIISMYGGSLISSERAEALSILLTGKVPITAIRKRPGNDQKMFSYVDHVWVTRKLRAAFGVNWGFEASEATIEADGTATAKGTLKVTITKSNKTVVMVFSDYGACNVNKGMTLANRKLSAASRALVRCAFRAFGVGEEFYETVDTKDRSPNELWDRIKAAIGRQKDWISEQDVIEYCEAKNIKKEDLPRRFGEVWTYMGLLIMNRKSENVRL